MSELEAALARAEKAEAELALERARGHKGKISWREVRAAHLEHPEMNSVQLAAKLSNAERSVSSAYVRATAQRQSFTLPVHGNFRRGLR